MPSTISSSSRMCFALLHLAGAAEQLVQRQHRVVRRVVGVVAGRPVDDVVPVPQREVVGDRDRLVVRDQEAVLRAGRRAPGAHARIGARLQQVGAGLRSRSSPAAPFSGSHFSCVPQPSSAGCMPSERKPSTDQVLTKTSIGFGFFARCVSRSAMWMPFTPSVAHQPRPALAIVRVRLARIDCRDRARGRAAPA